MIPAGSGGGECTKYGGKTGEITQGGALNPERAKKQGFSKTANEHVQRGRRENANSPVLCTEPPQGTSSQHPQGCALQHFSLHPGHLCGSASLHHRSLLAD